MIGYQKTVLDIVRIIAAMMVLIGHILYLHQVTIFKDESVFPYIQFIGVVILFLLSGFLTAFSVSKKNYCHEYTFGEFFTHKFTRIYKEYIPGLLFIALIDKIAIFVNDGRYNYYEAYKIKHFFGNLLMLHGMGPFSVLGRYISPFGTGRTLWSLSVEWWIYMLFGVIYLFISNKKKVTLPWAILFMGIIIMVSDHLITGRGGGLGFLFLLGVLAYYCYPLISLTAALVIFPLSFIIYIIYALCVKDAYTVYSFLILWLMFCSVVKIGCIRKNDKPNRNKILAFISKSTFMLYLTHFSIICMFLNSNLTWSVNAIIFAEISISLFVACVMYYLFGKMDVICCLIRTVKNKLFFNNIRGH